MATAPRTRSTTTENKIENLDTPRPAIDTAEAEAIEAAEQPQRPKEFETLFAEQTKIGSVLGKTDYYNDYTKKDLVVTVGETSISSKKQDQKTVGLMASYAASQGWTTIKVSGTKDFKREAWIEANMRGIEVKGYKPTDPDRQEARRRAEEQGLNISENKISADPAPAQKPAPAGDDKPAPATVEQMVEALQKAGYVLQKAQDQEPAPAVATAEVAAPATAKEVAPAQQDAAQERAAAIQAPAPQLTAEQVAKQAASYEGRDLSEVPQHLRMIVSQDRNLAGLAEKLKQDQAQAQAAQKAVGQMREDHERPRPLRAALAAVTGGRGALAKQQGVELSRVQSVADRRQSEVELTQRNIAAHSKIRTDAIQAVLKGAAQAQEPAKVATPAQAPTPAQSPAAKARAVYVDDYLRGQDKYHAGKGEAPKADQKIDAGMAAIAKEFEARGQAPNVFAVANEFRARDAKEFAAAEQAKAVDKREIREGMSAAEHRAVLRANRADLSDDGKIALAAFTAKIDKEMDQLNVDRKAELKAHAAVRLAEKERLEGPVVLTKEQRDHTTSPATPAQERANAQDHVSALKTHIAGSKTEASPKVIERYDQVALKLEKSTTQAQAQKAAPKPAPKAEAPPAPTHKRARKIGR